MRIIDTRGSLGKFTSESPNVFGFITEIRTIPSYAVTPSAIDNALWKPSPVNIEFSGMAPYSDAIMEILLGSSKLGEFARHANMWHCLYCGRSNELHRHDCESCGGTRSWLIG